MSNQRKLQTEIERVMKKVDEGVELFDEIWEKVYSAEQQNQKEKYEMDLKKEIKKLQRLRDQIKTWIGSSDVKDKEPLVEARKLIETKMEQFKICEKETKTKTYSKEGLAREERLDPAEEAKLNTTSWIGEYIERLHQAVEEADFEIERLSSGKGKKQNKHLIENFQEHIANHKYHISKLEGIIRLVNNDRLDVEPVDMLKDDLDYYLDSFEDEEYQQAYDEEYFYESLGLDELDIVNVDRVTQPTAAPKKPTDDTASSSSKGSGKGGKNSKKASLASVIPLTIGRARASAAKEAKEKEEAKPTPTKMARSSSIASTGSNNGPTPKTPAPAPVPPPAPAAAPAPVVAPPPAHAGASMAAILKRETEQQEKERQKLLREQQARAQAQQQAQAQAQAQAEQARQQQAQRQQQEALRQQEVLRQQQQQQQQQAAQQQAQQQQAQQEALQRQKQEALRQQQEQEAAAKQQAAQLQAQQAAAAAAAEQKAQSLQSQQLQQRQSAQTNALDILTAGLGAGLGLGTESRADVSAALQQGAGAPVVNNSSVAPPIGLDATSSFISALNESFATTPNAIDNDRSRQYTPQNPYPTPASYPSTPSSLFDNPAVFEKLGTDCLFFIFYYAQGTYQQYLAARELKKQSWRFHKKYMTWFQRHEEPKITTDEYEQGTYVYFDYETGWCTRIKTDFRFEYSYLEDSLQ